MNLLAGIWAKVTLALSLVIGVLLLRGKYQSSKIERLNDEIEIKDKKDEIKTKAAIDKATVLATEQDAILAMTKEVNQYDEEITLDDINNL